MSTATTRIDAREGPAPDRRVILACGILLLACLGTVYAWSYFTRQLGETYGWNKMQIGGVFSLAVAGLGLSAAYTGPLVASIGSRKLMMRSAAFFVTGYLVTALGLFLAGAGTFGAVTPVPPAVSPAGPPSASSASATASSAASAWAPVT